MRRLLRFILLNLLILLTLAAGAGLYLHQTKGLNVYSVQNNSQAPALKTGDLAIDISPHANSLKPGDIITYFSAQNPGIAVIHRIIKINAGAGYVITKGDNQPRADRQVPIGAITGQVVKAVPKAGYALDLLKHPAAITLLVYAPAAGLIIYEIQRASRHYTRRVYHTTDYA